MSISSPGDLNAQVATEANFVTPYGAHHDGPDYLDAPQMRIQREHHDGRDTYRLERYLGEDSERANRFLRGIEIKGLSPHTVRAYAYDLASLLG